jgi:hypothetical protein
MLQSAMDNHSTPAPALANEQYITLEEEAYEYDITRDPPESWYHDQMDLSRQAARFLWWGLIHSTRKA